MNYIKEIRISRFMNGNEDIKWNLADLSDPKVNILVGINGRGKTTLFKLIIESLSNKADSELDYMFLSKFAESIEIEFQEGLIVINPEKKQREFRNFSKENFEKLKITDINTFAIPIPESENPISAIRKLLGYEIKTTLDLLLSEYVLRFREHKERIDNKVFSLIKSSTPVNLIDYYGKIDALYNMIDEFLEETEKKLDREASPFSFLPKNISFLEISSGEKHLLLLLLVSFLNNNDDNNIIFLDEPEISLHLRWQEMLINKLYEINKKAQFIIVTHSPTLYGRKYMANRIDIESIFVMLETTRISYYLFFSNENNENIFRQEVERIVNSNISKTYQLNLYLKNIEKLSLSDYEKIKEIIADKINLDLISYATLIGRIDSFENGEILLNQMTPLEANDRILNTLLKKITDVESAIKFIKDKIEENITRVANFPDIITFSTLLGKARSKKDVEKIEELRKYLDIQTNEMYLNKLNYWNR